MQTNLWAIEWGVGLGDLRLGASRSETIARIAERGVKIDDDGEEWLFVDDLDLELRFDKRSGGLVEIVANDERATIAGLPTIGQRVHDLVDRLHADASDTLWTSEEEGGSDAAKERFDVLERPTDEDLLRGGTLWIPSRGLAFSLWYGEVISVRVRPPEDSPKSGAGPLTAAQRDLSRKENLNDLLAITPASVAGRGGNWIGRAWTLTFVATLGLVVWQAIQYQQRWNNAVAVEGTVVAVRPAPPDPFPSEFDVTYLDGESVERRTTFQRMEIYDLAGIGDKIEVRYLSEAPDRPMGPARCRDAAFQDFMPIGIGVVGVYLVVQTLAWIASSALRKLQRVEPMKTSIDREYDVGR